MGNLPSDLILGGLFHALAESRSGLSLVAKFSYLIQLLVEELLEIIKGLHVSEANYPIAISLLCERYRNLDKVRQILIHQFNNLPAPQSNLVDLKAFTIKARQLISQIQRRHQVLSAEDYVKSIFVQKLPKRVYELIVTNFFSKV